VRLSPNLIDAPWQVLIDEAIHEKARTVESIRSWAAGQLKQEALRFLDHKDIERHYHQVDKDSDNFGRVIGPFR
jgi:hypothetical protein